MQKRPDKNTRCDEDASGATSLEYALLAALIAAVVAAAVLELGNSACNAFSKLGSGIGSP